MKNWFDSWFDTKYYHILYKNRDFSEAENFITNLTSDLKIAPNKSILDLACGKGRHSIFLNKLGYKTTGVDLSKQSIEHANQFKTPTLDFFVHDMREQIKNNSFDYVFNLFTSIGYFEDESDNLKMLNSIDSYTNENGVLVIDFMNANKVVSNLVLDEVKVIEGITFTINRKVENGFIIKTISFTDNNQKFNFQEKVQALELHHFENYLKETNF